MNVPSEWVEAVATMAKDAGARAQRVTGIKVSRGFVDKYGPIRTVWGIPVEVDVAMYGDGFRAVVEDAPAWKYPTDKAWVVI